MSASHNKVVWSEGMFLQPQHFQQHDRYLEHHLEARCADLTPYPWGVTELEIDHGLLAMGKVAVNRCRGIFPDGTPLSIPEEDAGLVIEVPASAKNRMVYLALPARRSGMIETGNNDLHTLARCEPVEIEVADDNAGSAAEVPVLTGRLQLRLLLEGEDLSAFACIGVARVVERHDDGLLVLDEGYLPPALCCSASERLAGWVGELENLLRHRGNEIAVRIAEPGRGGVAEVSDFLLLQLVNRYQPLLAHLKATRNVHPERFYRIATSMAGELATFTAETRRPTDLPAYRHDALRESLEPVMAELRRELGLVLEQQAIPIPLQEHKYGIRLATVHDRSLFEGSVFVLAVNADVPSETLRATFPAEVKVGPSEKIRELVNLHLPGVALRPLPVAPRQIPYHAGFTYFELDRNGEMWRAMATASGCAIHIAGDYPGLVLELWAIRG